MFANPPLPSYDSGRVETASSPGASGSLAPSTPGLTSPVGQASDYANFTAAQASYVAWATKFGLINQSD
ncbi:MAG TPA: hypothetical protein VKV39_06655 [Candidatus Sulfotelmatobacter sp.]|nr:hypothetical protein [Candidatus Sulfotelmatobacter sp.]